MHVIRFFIIGIFSLFGILSFSYQRIFAQTSDRIIGVDIPLTRLNVSTLHANITQEKDVTVGDPQPNYEYSGHIIKMPTSPVYRMFYGGRCFYDQRRNYQIPSVPYNPGQEYSQTNGGGDGDHVRYAYSDNGLDFTRTLTPLIRPGKYEGVQIPSYDYDNHMDPTIIKWSNTYYMYYQVQVTPSSEPWPIRICPSGQQCDKILYATSSDLITWTKHDQPVIINDQPKFMFAWPKAIVLDGQIWLYFGLMNSEGSPNQYNGGFLIKSIDPTRFDFTQKIRQSEPFEWGQRAVLWPDNPQKRLHIQVMTNWSLYNTTGRKIPTLSFSKDGINWFYSDGAGKGTPISFPSYFQSRNHTFCNIVTEINGGLTPSLANSNKIETFYYCATFSGFHADVWTSDISAGKLVFSIPLMLIGDLNSGGQVDIFDYNLLITDFGKTGSLGFVPADIDKDGKVDIFDYNTLVGNFGKTQ